MSECNEYQALESRGFRDYSLGHQKMYSVPIDLLKADQTYDIIDVGFGIGWGLERMIHAGIIKNYIGVEPCSDSFNYVAAKVSDPKIQLFPLPWLETPSELLFAADYVFCIEVVEHLADNEVEEFLRKLWKFTGKNLFLSTPDRNRHNHGTKTLAAWQWLLREVGFDDVVAIDSQWTTLYICG